ncbi:major facilitator superfamily-domain-containing protein [Boletus edulis BED1]|uniref:Major facilitator superfamily-domain-containing protein n=1 Tax=Boletus edulis BED1 TaxID=1328754 RepID=A0AAD4GFM6_BOLED|nr:major facilitator superfamily-domain-containing protein [Boletus edulis BED1]
MPCAESDDKLALSQPVSTVTTRVADGSKKSVESPLQLTDQTNLLPFRKIIPVFAGLALCGTISALDSVIIATALPTISDSFNAGSIASWVPSAYMLTSTSFQPLYGRFSDIFGRKPALCVAMGVYVLGSMAAGFSTSIIQLIIFRGFAGAGGGGIQSMAQIIVSDIVSLRDRGKYQGIISGAIALGYAIGPPIGGALAQRVTWRWCFWVTLPISLFAICVVYFVLPLKQVEGNAKEKLMAVDYLGTVLTLIGFVLILLPLIWGGVTFPWNSPIVLGSLCSGILVVFLFCLWEWKGARLPIVPMHIFSHVTVIGVYIAMFINGFLFFSSLYYLPQFFQVALGYSPIQSGVLLLPVLVSQSLANWTTGLIVSRTGRYRTNIYVGFIAWAVGCGCLSTVRASTSKVLLVVYMLLSGMGAGQTLPTTTVAAQASVPRQDMSVVTAVRNLIRLLGGTLALAVGFTLINNSLRSDLSSFSLSPTAITAVVDNPAILGPNTPASTLAPLGLTHAMTSYVLLHGYAAGFELVFILNACLAAVAAIVSFFMIKHTELTRSDEETLRAEALVALHDGGETQHDAEKGMTYNGKKGSSEYVEHLH